MKDFKSKQHERHDSGPNLAPHYKDEGVFQLETKLVLFHVPMKPF